MARLERYKGQTIDLTVDLSSISGFTQVYLEIYKEPKLETKFKFAYPAATGYTTMTKSGDEYTASLTGANTLTMSGDYGVELTYVLSGKTVKSQIDSTSTLLGITILSEAV